MEVKVKKLNEQAKIPTRATSGSAGYDLYALLSESIEIMPRQIVKIPTGLAISLSSNDYVALVFARSGLATKFGIALANGVGVIDSDYRGELIVSVCNITDTPHTINPFDRIAQMVILPVILPTLTLCDELDQTQRGEGGFGSTGNG
ncbi:MAG: dUTP diphosphatase [Oscillospiraceae bacterium]|jgi:dUTP pyrophosphatase|nr:dUTP diphosphatase [Oscillospiraceae bacterium]